MSTILITDFYPHVTFIESYQNGKDTSASVLGGVATMPLVGDAGWPRLIQKPADDDGLVNGTAHPEPSCSSFQLPGASGIGESAVTNLSARVKRIPKTLPRVNRRAHQTSGLERRSQKGNLRSCWTTEDLFGYRGVRIASRCRSIARREAGLSRVRASDEGSGPCPLEG
ncbi:MAG: hypothetical protein BJ554DRAFT_5071 [Olpidium bornovanus]|uniref:Uncharacterized protein n=1 Tax=Olpidium bornovanus TaxID=278681 RepID=A0A8H8DER1_9FUNG|nr:MAG: hypothetical protein BJ554DRAFT_5071 [Olpidium bornovanus]